MRETNYKDFSWKILKNTLIPKNILQEFSEFELRSVKKLLNTKGYYFASYTSSFDQKEISDFWYIINDTPLTLEDYSRKVRYEIKQSLNRCNLKIVNPGENWDTLFTLYNSALNGYKNYNYRLNFAQFKEEIFSQIDKIDIWLISKTNNTAVGYAYIIKNNKYIDLYDIKIDPNNLDCLPIYNLLYHINIYYLSERSYQFISDGRKSMFHETTFQSFLEKKFLYRKAYSKLHIEYSTIISLLIPLIRFFKFIILLFPNFGPFKKLTLLINYDQISTSLK